MFLARELNEKLAGGRIEKIVMDEKATVMIFVRSGSKTHNLIFTTSVSPRCYVTSARIQSTAVPLSFALHLRKHIGNGIVKDIECEPFERILRISISSRNELGDEGDYVLIAELMGKYSNVLLTNKDGIITDALKHIPLSEFHSVLPGLKYEMPGFGDKISPTDPRMDKYAGCGPAEIVSAARGLARITAEEILFIAKSEGLSLSRSAALLLSRDARPALVLDENGEIADYTFCHFSSVTAKTRSVNSICEAMDAYFLPRESLRAVESEKSKIKRIVSTHADKLKKKLSLFLNEEQSAADYEKEKKIGDLITANLHRAKKGDGVLIASDWETGEEIKIRLTEESPQMDAQKHFKRYQKKKRTLEAVAGQIQSAKDEIDYYENLLLSVDSAQTLEEIEEICEELEGVGLLNANPAKKKKTKESKPRVFVIDDYTVLVGKNNIQNDKITKQAKGEDVWMHTQGIHGSHVIIKSKGTQIPRNVLEAAGRIAAFFSKARASSNVPVDYTKAKNVHKPKGAVPGKMDYFSAKTIFVDPGVPQK